MIHCLIICQAPGALVVVVLFPTLQPASTMFLSFMSSCYNHFYIGGVGVYMFGDCSRSILCGSVHYCCSHNCCICPLSWRWSRNCCAWGLGDKYRFGRVDLENRTLVCCGGVLESYYVGGCDGCRYVGLIYCGIRARNVEPGVSGHDISLAVSIWRTWPWFLIAVDWSHSV